MRPPVESQNITRILCTDLSVGAGNLGSILVLAPGKDAEEWQWEQSGLRVFNMARWQGVLGTAVAGPDVPVQGRVFQRLGSPLTAQVEWSPCGFYSNQQQKVTSTPSGFGNVKGWLLAGAKS